MARLAALPLILALVAGLAGCSDEPSSGGPTSTAPPVPDTPPVELFVTEDLVHVGVVGLYADDGSVLLRYEGPEPTCIRGAVGDELWLDTASVGAPGTVDDPDDEQLLAEAVVACVDLDRLRGLVRSQLADQPTLEGIDPSCLDREIEALRSQPDVLAAVLRGDENARPAVAGTMAENCSP